MYSSSVSMLSLWFMSASSLSYTDTHTNTYTREFFDLSHSTHFFGGLCVCVYVHHHPCPPMSKTTTFDVLMNLSRRVLVYVIERHWIDYALYIVTILFPHLIKNPLTEATHLLAITIVALAIHEIVGYVERSWARNVGSPEVTDLSNHRLSTQKMLR